MFTVMCASSRKIYLTVPRVYNTSFFLKIILFVCKRKLLLISCFGNNGKLIFCWLILSNRSDFPCWMRSHACLTEGISLPKLARCTLECVDDRDGKKEWSGVKGLPDDCFLMMAQRLETAFCSRIGSRGRA